VVKDGKKRCIVEVGQLGQGCTVYTVTDNEQEYNPYSNGDIMQEAIIVNGDE